MNEQQIFMIHNKSQGLVLIRASLCIIQTTLYEQLEGCLGLALAVLPSPKRKLTHHFLPAQSGQNVR